MPDRNFWGKYQDFITGSTGQTSNLELLRNFLFTPRTQPTQPLPPNYPGSQIDDSMFPERGKYVNMNELLSVPMPQGQQRPPIPQEFLNMPTDMGVNAYRNSLYPTLATPPTIESPIEPQRNETLNIAQGIPQQPTQQPNRNNLLMAALFGGVAPALAAAFGGETGLAAGSGLAQGFGTQFAKGQEKQQELQLESTKETEKRLYEQQKQLEKETRDNLNQAEELATKEGIDLEIDKKLPPEQQLRNARVKLALKIRDKLLNAKPTKWDIQKEARITVNAMINQNPELQMQAFNNPNLLTDMINKEVKRLSKEYGLSEKETYTSEEETLITDNMKAYGKSREEIISALQNKGILE